MLEQFDGAVGARRCAARITRKKQASTTWANVVTSR
jgi:hypothetical protein